MVINKPKYVQIIDFLTQEIENEVYHINDKLPSESELMKKFSVSRIVAVSALNKMAEDKTIYRIAGKGSFVTDPKNIYDSCDSDYLFEKEWKHVSLIVINTASKYASSLVNVLVETLYQCKIHCSVHYSLNNREMESNLIEYAMNSGQDGIILYPCDSDKYSQQLLTAIKKGFPIVLIDRDLPGLGLSCVSTDNQYAIRLATNHLIKLGHKKICLFTRNFPSTVFVDRTKGFLFEMMSQNVMVDPSLVLTDYSEESLRDKLENIILKKLATAVICISTYDYEIFTELLSQHNYSCPQDFSVIHFDEDFIVNGGNTTHIVQNCKLIAQNTADIMKNIFKSGSNSCEKISVPPFFVQGSTTAAIDAD